MTNAEHRIPRGDSLCPKNQAKTDVQDQESNLEIYAYGCNSLIRKFLVMCEILGLPSLENMIS